MGTDNANANNANTAAPMVWHDDQVVFGMRVRAFFFDPAVVDAKPTVERLLPFFQSARPTLLMTESDSGYKNLKYREIIAQPDALFGHGNGFIAVEYKSNSDRPHNRNGWTRQIRLSSMLQALVAAMAVAGAKGKPAAAVLRCHNVAYLLSPTPGLLGMLASRVATAKVYWDERRFVSSSQFAKYCEPLVRERLGEKDQDDARSAAGRRRHAEMLAR